MANYEYVMWQPDDEVTSTKLQQMSDNSEWLRDNLILGDAVRVGANGGELLPTPFLVGTSKIKRIDAKVKPFNSQVPVTFLDMDMEMPPGYSNTPFCIPSVTDVHGRGYYINMRRYNGLHSVTFRITQGDSVAKIISGQVQAIFIEF